MVIVRNVFPKQQELAEVTDYDVVHYKKVPCAWSELFKIHKQLVQHYFKISLACASARIGCNS